MSTSISASPVTSALRRTTVVVGVLGAAATTAAAAAMRASGVHLAAHGTIPLPAFAMFTFVAAVVGGVVLGSLNRRSAPSRRRFTQVAVALTALSCLAPAAGGDDLSSKVGLIALHLVAAAIIVPVLVRQTAH